MSDIPLEDIQELIDESGVIDVLQLPAYVREPLENQDIENLERAIYLCLQLIEEKKLEEKAEVEKEDIPEEVKEELEKGGGPVRQEEKVKCGKDDCNSCPHGPYIYEYEWVPGRGVVSRYIGKA